MLGRGAAASAYGTCTASASSAATVWHRRQPHPVSKQGSANSTGTQTASGRGRAGTAGMAIPDAKEQSSVRAHRWP